MLISAATHSAEGMGMAMKAVGLWVVMLGLVRVAAAVRVQELMITPAASECESLKAVKSPTFRAPPLRFRAGEVRNLWHFVDAPPGHYATRDFFGELVDENGISVPLYKIYLHHWFMYEYAVPKGGMEKAKVSLLREVTNPESYLRHHRKPLKDYPGVEDEWTKMQQFGVGAETRRSKFGMPAPYGFEAGNRFGNDYESLWLLNVHGIDTRGAVDRMQCIECRCDVYNHTDDAVSRGLPEGYHGGLLCCSKNTDRCPVKDAFQGDEFAMDVYFQYTWSYVPWDECVEPLKCVRVDVTNVGDGEKLEYEVEACNPDKADSDDCVDTHISYQAAAAGGHLISAVAHLHESALSAVIWGEDERLLCSSPPIYGRSNVAGDEADYVVGVQACFPTPGTPSYTIKKGEIMRFEVNYSRIGAPHVGLMGIMYLKIAPARPAGLLPDFS